MSNINFKKYKRFFAFGCSFTNYSWPTWADLIAQEIDESYNYGRSGAGNFFIYQSLMEAIIKHNINKDDLVMVMFSSVIREDRFTKKTGWITPGNLYYQSDYDTKFLNKFLCDHGYLIRDLNLVNGCIIALESIGCRYELMSMIPFQSKTSSSEMMTEVEYILDFYKESIGKIKTSVFEIIFKNDWSNRPIRPRYLVPWQKEYFIDNHPTTNEHLEYLQTIFSKDSFSQELINFADRFDKIILKEDFKNNTIKGKQEIPKYQIDYIRDIVYYRQNIAKRLGEDASI